MDKLLCTSDEIFQRRSVITINKMMEKRGYSPLEDTNKKSLQDCFFSLIFQKDEKQVYVVWVDEKFGNSTIKLLKDILDELSINHCILIYKDKITAYAKATIRALIDQDITFEIFKRDSVIVDITEHKLVSKHAICSEEEKQKILEQYDIKITQLPKISLIDPQVRYLGAKKGQVIKIIRKSDSIPDININNKSKEFYELNYRVVV